MTALVTGATGFIGGRLIQENDRALVRRPIGFSNEAVGNLADIRSLEHACNGVETVFHCAGYAHAFTSSAPEAHHETNYCGTKNLLEAAATAGVKRFVFLSSVKAMAEPGKQCVDEAWPGEPATQYGRTKRAAELAVLEAGTHFNLHVVNLRLTMVYGRGGRGNLERLARGLRAGWFPILPETGNLRSFVHVDDVVAVMRLVADQPEANGRTYIVAEPRAYSGRELSEAIRSISPTPKFSWSAPACCFRFGGKLGDIAGAISSRRMPVNSEVVSRLLDSACYSPALIEHELGWRAKVGLVDGLREMLTPVRQRQ